MHCNICNSLYGRCFKAIATVLLVVVFGLASGCIEEKNYDLPDDAVVIGLLLPYTGGDAAIGTNYERAAIIARDLINASGGINNRPISFVAKDTHSDPVRARKALQELMAYDVHAVIGPEGAEIARQILPILQKNKILFISPVVSGADTLPVSVTNPWIRLAPSSSKLGHVFANHLMFERDLNTISTVYSADDYNTDFVRSLEERFTELGGTVETSLRISGSALSYGEEVYQLRLGATTNLVLAAPIDSASRFVNEITITDSAHKWQWFLAPGLETPVFLQNTIQSAVEGATGVGIEVENPDHEFIAMYRERWSDEPLDGAFFYYDAVSVLSLAIAAAIRNSGGPLNYEGIVAAMSDVASPSGIQIRWSEHADGFRHIMDGRRLYYSGLTGPLLFTDEGQQQKALMATWSISNGQITKSETL